MGGFGSGRHGGRPTADLSLRVDIAWMVRTGRAVPGAVVSGGLSWTYGPGDPAGSIGYRADMRDLDNATLVLTFVRGAGDARKTVHQNVRLVHSTPHYGGRRWWMVCPYHGHRVGKLYLPGGGDAFASRKAWRLGYRSQRIAARDRPFEAMFRLQAKLGGAQGYDMGLARRPKHMWHRTYQRLWQEHDHLDELCTLQFGALFQRMGMPQPG